MRKLFCTLVALFLPLVPRYVSSVAIINLSALGLDINFGFFGNPDLSLQMAYTAGAKTARASVSNNNNTSYSGQIR